VCYLLLVFVYTFYRANFRTKELSVSEFPKIPIQDYYGEFKTITDFKGKVVLVNFWFSTCPLSLDEMKYFPELLARYDDLAIMSFNIDSLELAKEILKNKPEPWKFIDTENPRWIFYQVDRYEKDGYVDQLNIKSFPTYFLIDRNGDILSSPDNAIFFIEQKLGGKLSLSTSFKNYIDDFDWLRILKILGIFHGMVAIIVAVQFFYDRKIKTRSDNEYE
jgi:thiol-disulfide isomerase/thioredoxin